MASRDQLGRLLVSEVLGERGNRVGQELFEVPVVAADGNTYENAAIRAWLETHHTSPLVRRPSRSRTTLASIASSAHVRKHQLPLACCRAAGGRYRLLRVVHRGLRLEITKSVQILCIAD